MIIRSILLFIYFLFCIIKFQWCDIYYLLCPYFLHFVLSSVFCLFGVMLISWSFFRFFIPWAPPLLLICLMGDSLTGFRYVVLHVSDTSMNVLNTHELLIYSKLKQICQYFNGQLMIISFCLPSLSVCVCVWLGAFIRHSEIHSDKIMQSIWYGKNKKELSNKRTNEFVQRFIIVQFV